MRNDDHALRLLPADGTPAERELVERRYRRMGRQSQEVMIDPVESALGVTVGLILCDLDAAAGEPSPPNPRRSRPPRAGDLLAT